MKATNFKTQRNRVVSILLSIAMLVGIVATMPFTASANVFEQVFAYPDKGYTVTYTIYRQLG